MKYGTFLLRNSKSFQARQLNTQDLFPHREPLAYRNQLKGSGQLLEKRYEQHQSHHSQQSLGFPCNPCRGAQDGQSC